mgnify:CR=1 FL=1
MSWVFHAKRSEIFKVKIPELADADCEFLHWGDMDYGGISIFQFIKKNVFPELKPYKMDRTAFEGALKDGAGIVLEHETRKKLEAKDAGLLEELKQVNFRDRKDDRAGAGEREIGWNFN